jgi:hypothetical protein
VCRCVRVCASVSVLVQAGAYCNGITDNGDRFIIIKLIVYSLTISNKKRKCDIIISQITCCML